ncbi:MAG: SDR family NAD(P)-dependent oxidoreductase [Clostridia bacterium]|nr:SDR family NAD(P)-dependent oxidoreductase [Clostridia bacterium]
MITGATSGIGRKLVDIFLNEYGCEVLGVSRNEEKAQKVYNEISAYTDKYSKYCFDVSDKNSWFCFANHLLENSFVPDLIINNAGVLPKFRSALKTEIDDIEHVLKTDFFSAVYSFKSMQSVFGQKIPAFVNVSSSAALATLAGTCAYSSAKSALRAFTECLSYELKNINYVAVVCPGFTKTDIFKNQSQSINSGIVGKFSMPVEKMAKKIVKGIKNKKKRMIYGKDAHFMSILARVMPKKSTDILSGVLKMSKMELFNEVFGD